MGLDQYLYKVPKSAKPEMEDGVGPITSENYEDRSQWASRNEIAYWRKENAIHRWFVEVAGKNAPDDCTPILVHSEQLPDLYERCQKVLMDHSLAPELLPTQGGFSFGPTEYDEWYFRGLEDTVKMLEERVINDPTTWGCDIYYQASW